VGRLIAPLATAVRFVGQNQAVYIPRSAIDTALDEWIFWNKKTHARLIAKSPRSWVFRACSLAILPRDAKLIFFRLMVAGATAARRALVGLTDAFLGVVGACG